jgi:hypothetical protein
MTMSELGPTDPSLAHRCEMNDGTQVAEKKAEAAIEEYVLARQQPRRRSVLHNGTWKHDLDKPTAAHNCSSTRTHTRTHKHIDTRSARERKDILKPNDHEGDGGT